MSVYGTILRFNRRQCHAWHFLYAMLWHQALAGKRMFFTLLDLHLEKITNVNLLILNGPPERSCCNLTGLDF